jgi:hypothetical protein
MDSSIKPRKFGVNQEFCSRVLIRLFITRNDFLVAAPIFVDLVYRLHRKKKATLRWLFNLVGREGLEPPTKGLCLPLRLSPPVSGLWSGLYLAFRPSRRVSTRSPLRSFARYWHGITAAAFTDVEKFYSRAELTYPVQPILKSPCTNPFRISV